jgi:hypothetical protein
LLPKIFGLCATDPKNFDVDPDSNFQFGEDLDLDPAIHFDANPLCKYFWLWINTTGITSGKTVNATRPS